MLLTFLLGGFSASATGRSSTSSGGGGGGADVREELANVLSLQCLGEETGPVALNCVSASLDDLVQFLFLSPRHTIDG